MDFHKDVGPMLFKIFMNELEKEVTSKMTLICYTKLINKCNEKENQNNNNNKKKKLQTKKPTKSKIKR